MIRLHDALRELISRNPFLQFGLNERLFNLTQLSRFLAPQIGVKAKKSVQPAAVLMALSRLQRQTSASRKSTAFHIDQIAIQTNLSTFTYPKTRATHRGVEKLYSAVQALQGFITVAEGTRQITVIVGSEFTGIVRSLIEGKPEFVSKNVASVGVRFSEQYIEVPGFIFVVLQQLMLMGINLVEISSTYTELILYVTEQDARDTFDLISALFRDGERRG